MGKLDDEEERHLPDKPSYTKEEIDSIDVFYCNACLSLRVIRGKDSGLPDYCHKCGSTYINRANISEVKNLIKLK